jgi:RHS repeat-associated protein
MLLEAASADAENRTGGFNFEKRYRGAHPGHVAVAHHWGIRPLRLRIAPRKTLYEEYHPYGTSSYRAMKSGVEVSAKRYRYTGKERDEETGLYYHGARYYAPWLGRWVAADPAGLVDGPGLYSYCRGSPVVMSDPSGMQGTFNMAEHPRPNADFSMTDDPNSDVASAPLSVKSRTPDQVLGDAARKLRGKLPDKFHGGESAAEVFLQVGEGVVRGTGNAVVGTFKGAIEAPAVVGDLLLVAYLNLEAGARFAVDPDSPETDAAAIKAVRTTQPVLDSIGEFARKAIEGDPETAGELLFSLGTALGTRALREKNPNLADELESHTLPDDEIPLPEGRRGTIQANKAAGDAFEAETLIDLRQQQTGVVTQVTIEAQSGVSTRLDFVGKDPAGKFALTDAKASPTAPLTRNQRKAFPEIEVSGGVVKGKGKPGVPGGTRIPPTKVDIRRKGGKK